MFNGYWHKSERMKYTRLAQLEDSNYPESEYWNLLFLFNNTPSPKGK
jgi:hypothetical protein